ncbi:hypothetical protein Moror_751 [Moniliophthora roreri MCA 2997]|uniref:Uncharacterized protein n=1 Tax=Moniliophthora roreri (strain MCA 2997) TaxID=1381753 RepID=V2WSW2_MONRO|nr:hypothetical protein Moror_751 [Moniliophthora roreri MCA 2997]
MPPPMVPNLIYSSTIVICQTLLYGVYITLMPFSIYFAIKKGLGTPIRRFLFIATLAMFLFSTVYWALKIRVLMELIMYLDKIPTALSDAESPKKPTGIRSTSSVENIFGAIVLINYLLTDGVVLWRALVLCGSESKRLLRISLFFMVWCTLTVTSTIAIRFALELTSSEVPRFKTLTRAIDVCQVGNLIASFSTNVIATFVIALKAWRYRRWVLSELWAVGKKKGAGAERVLVLLTESGLFYCISGVMVLVASLIRLPVGTLGSIYTPVHVQIAGIYPIIVFLLVNQGKSLDQTVFCDTVDAPRAATQDLETLRFHVRSTIVTVQRPEVYGDRATVVDIGPEKEKKLTM